MTQRHNGHSLENVLKHEQSQSSNCLCVIVHFLSKFTHTFNQWQCAQMCIPKLAWVIRYGQQIWPPVADGITVHIVVQIYININIHVKKNSRYHNSASLCVWSKWRCNTDIVEIYWQESLCLKNRFLFVVVVFGVASHRVPFYSQNHREGSFWVFSLNKLHKEEEVKLLELNNTLFGTFRSGVVFDERMEKHFNMWDRYEI